jgi:hypothetical protein
MDSQTDTVLPIALQDIGLTRARPVRCLALTEQVAQKVHALTEPMPRGRPNARARDVLDVLLLDARLGLDPIAVSAACARVFSERNIHSWPIVRFSFPLEWTPTLTELARQAAYNTTDIAVIETRFNTFLARLQGVQVMPGYEYQFVSLQPTAGGALASPITTSGTGYEQFAKLAALGWRVRAMSVNPRYPDQLLVLLEKEIQETK